jgi:hypothetical protein
MQKRRSIVFWPLLASLATGINAYADIGVVLGAQGGYADINWNEFEDSESVTGYVAYRFVDWFGLEAGVAMLGDFDVEDGDSALTDVTMTYAGLHFHGQSGFFGMSASAILGGYQSDIERDCANCANTDDKTSDSGFTYGARLGIPVMDMLDITLGWQNFYKVEDDTHFNLYQAGVELHF